MGGIQCVEVYGHTIGNSDGVRPSVPLSYRATAVVHTMGNIIESQRLSCKKYKSTILHACLVNADKKKIEILNECSCTSCEENEEYILIKLKFAFQASVCWH